MPSRFRLLIILFMIIVLSFLLFYKLYDLGIKKHSYYLSQLNIKTNLIIEGSTAPRGRILDRNGKILVDNISNKIIVYTKFKNTRVEDEINIAYKISKKIKIEGSLKDNEIKRFYLLLYPQEEDDLVTKKELKKYEERKISDQELMSLKYKRITKNDLEKLTEFDLNAALIYFLMNKGYSYEKKVLKSTDVTDEEYAYANENNIKGLSGELSWERCYPYQNTFRSILGTVSSYKTGIPIDLKDYYLGLGYSLNDRVGISYLEQEYEKYLKGTKAKYKVNNDNTLSLIEEGKSGNDLILNIDIDIQQELEKILEEQIKIGKKLRNTEYYDTSYAILGNPNDGSIIAMAGVKVTGKKNNYQVSDVTTQILTNSYVMGSVVKGATIAVGYNNGFISSKMRVLDSCVKLYSVPAKCSFKRLGRINDIKALANSSNYYQFLIAIDEVGKKYKNNMVLNAREENFQKYRDTLAEYGLGVKTEIDLPNELVGIKGKNIADDLFLNMAIGQYDTYTPLELLQYINTIALGKRIDLSLMKETSINNKKVIDKPQDLNKLSISFDNLLRVQEGFRQVLISGTGRGYTPLKYKPAGKTGTSESFIDSNLDGVVDVKTNNSSYAMYFPYDSPKYSMVVMSPNVSHKNGKTDYLAFINKAISKEIANKLFEKLE